jgi:translation elongation factor P/translation initiation factor 5A
MEKLDNTFSAGHKIEEVRVENHKYQYLSRRRRFSFMNTETFEQISLTKIRFTRFTERRKCYGINTETELFL